MSSISQTMLGRLRLGDSDTWTRFVQLYGPVLYACCRRAGVPARDVGDVGQDIFLDIQRGLPSFRHDRPGDTFRGWVGCITRRRIADYWRRQGHSPEGPPQGGSTALRRVEQAPDPVSDPPSDPSSADQPAADAQDRHDTAALLQSALALVRQRFEPRTWQACWLTVAEDRPTDEVARQLGMTPNAVRIAKKRVLDALRAEFSDLLPDLP